MRFLSRTVFSGLSFRLSKTESIAITGRNGSGKSTLLKIIATLLKQNGGTIKLISEGKEIPRQKLYLQIGMIAPYLNLYEELTAFENLDFFFNLKCKHNFLPKVEYINELLSRTGLYKRRNDQVRSYSSGMKQRLKIAFALINKPPLLLMDEPRTNLDKEGIDIIYSVAEEQKKNGILIVATNENEDTNLCSDVLNIESFKKK